MRLLDLFCGAGGCSVGYARAGFEVVGVDIEPHPDYPFEFIQADAMDLLRGMVVPPADRIFRPEGSARWYSLDDFDAFHGSPPCPRHSIITPDATRDDHPDLIGPVRAALRATGKPYVIENVPGAPLENPALYCGGAFGLGTTCRDGVYRPLQRHRLFESNVWLMSPGCACDHRVKLGVYGDGGGGPSTRPSGGGGYKAWPDEARAGMGCEWMTSRGDLSDTIPPAYTQHIGEQLMAHLKSAAA